MCWTAKRLCYDADGNLRSDGEHTFSWDAENRLREMLPGTAGNGKRLVFSYDYMGRRIRKRVFGWGGNACDS